MSHEDSKICPRKVPATKKNLNATDVMSAGVPLAMDHEWATGIALSSLLLRGARESEKSRFEV